MAALLFICPITRMKVQHWLDDDEDASEDDYDGKVLGDGDPGSLP